MTPEQEQVLSEVAGGQTRGPAEWALLKLLGEYMIKRYGEVVRIPGRDDLYAKILAGQMLRKEEREAAVAEEREACAKLVDDGCLPTCGVGLDHDVLCPWVNPGDAIRARGST